MDKNDIKAVESIRAGYVEADPTRLDELKALNKRVRKPATVFAYVFGTVGSLVLGTGMCLAMKVIGDAMLAGIGIGLVGIAMVSVNYSIYKAILGARKKKYAARIIALSDEILEN